MRLISLFAWFFLALVAPLAGATKLIESNALSLCQDSSNFTATYFSVTFTPNNRSLAFGFDGVASISGKVKAELILTVYGYAALRKELDPCEMNLAGLCPMQAGPIDVPTANIAIPESVVSQFPSKYTPQRIDVGKGYRGLTCSPSRYRIYCARSRRQRTDLHQLN